jgi:hypothetical protein
MAKNKSRAVAVAQRWKEARLYAERHGTIPRLDRRTVQVKLTNEDIEHQVRGLFKAPKKRLSGGRRGTESKRIREEAYFRLTLTDKKGRVEAQSGTLKFQRAKKKEGESRRSMVQREAQELTHALRRANNGVFNLHADYAALKGKVQVTEEGTFEVEGEPWTILLEPDIEGEPLREEYEGEAG